MMVDDQLKHKQLSYETACLTRGFFVHSITMDGHALNQAVVKLLGASMDVNNLQPYFQVSIIYGHIFIS